MHRSAGCAQMFCQAARGEHSDSRDNLAPDSDTPLSLTLMLHFGNSCRHAISAHLAPTPTIKTQKKPRCASGCACLINKTCCFLFLATRCLPGSTDMSFLRLPQRLGRSPRQVKVGGPVISQSDMELYNSCSVPSRRNLYYEGTLMGLVFVLLASLLIRASCS